jgi:hypothetical protein
VTAEAAARIRASKRAYKRRRDAEARAARVAGGDPPHTRTCSVCGEAGHNAARHRRDAHAAQRIVDGEQRTTEQRRVDAVEWIYFRVTLTPWARRAADELAALGDPRCPSCVYAPCRCARRSAQG